MLEKSHKLFDCDRIEDSDEHIEHVDNHLDYYHDEGSVNFKLFKRTLMGVFRKSYKYILNRSINSLSGLCDDHDGDA